MNRIEYVGVDGCPGGWFSVGLDGNGEGETRKFNTFKELLGHYSDAALILVDIPIGLPEEPGGRKCDYMARGLPGFKRKSSIFPTPTRQTVQQACIDPQGYEAAKKVEYAVTGKKISKQAFAIVPKIAEVDRALTDSGKQVTPVVREVHPEVCFWALNGKSSMKFSKKKDEGREERLKTLEDEDVFPKAREVYRKACEEYRTQRVGSDDIIDAMVAAVTALRGHDKLRTIPETPLTDNKGLPMEMVYWP